MSAKQLAAVRLAAMNSRSVAGACLCATESQGPSVASTPVKPPWMKAWRRSRGDTANAQRASSLPAAGG